MTSSVCRVWIVSELYYPEETSTGYYVTGIAEGLGDRFSVSAVCAQPTYAARGLRAPAEEKRHGVLIRRCRSLTLDKNVVVFRVLNLTTFSLSVFSRLLRELRRGDVVLAVTNPPTLPIIAALACRWKKARLVLVVHDVYPDVLVAAGLARRGGVASRVADWLARAVYKRAERIVVIGRDMKALIERKSPGTAGRLTTITHWADLDEIRPAPRTENRILRELGLTERFVVQYAGNMGRTHDLELLLAASERLRSDPRIHFLLAGTGAKRARVKAWVDSHPGAAVTLLDRQERTRLSELLGACDLAIVPLVGGMAGVSVPSRMYNILAAGRPILAVADESSELARMVTEESIGLVVAPGDVEGVVRGILWASENPAALAEMGRRSRVAAEARYSLHRVGEQYRQLVREVGGGRI